MGFRRLLFAAVVSALFFSGCDAVRSFLGMPTSEEIEAAKALERKLAEQKKADSIAALRADSLASAVPDSIEKKDESGRYMVIVGSFRDPGNADRMLSLLKKKGYEKAGTVKFRNGFDVVSAYSSDSFSEVLKQMYTIMETVFCPEDIWIYDRTEALHEE